MRLALAMVLATLRELDANHPSDAMSHLTKRYSLDKLHPDLRSVEGHIMDASSAAAEAGAAIVRARHALTAAAGELVVASDGMPTDVRSGGASAPAPPVADQQETTE